jgi:hypothetical protein
MNYGIEYLKKAKKYSLKEVIERNKRQSMEKINKNIISEETI